MRILKFVHSEDDGGVFTSEIQFIKELQKQSHQVDLVIFGHGTRCEEYKKISDNFYCLDSKSNAFILNKSVINKTILLSNRSIRKVADEVLNNLGHNYNAVIFRKLKFIVIAAYCAKIDGLDCYWHMPNSVEKTKGKIRVNLLVRKHGITAIANSHYTKKSIGSICKYVVYPGFSYERIRPDNQNVDKIVSPERDGAVYGIAARLHPDKAQDIVIKAFLDSGLIRNNVKLAIAGGPLDTEYAKELMKISKAEIGKSIIFLDRVSDISKFYSSVDIIINGRRNAEPFGISIVEALASGKPVIAYHMGAPREIIEPNETGWLVSEPDITSYKETILKSYTMRGDWREMSEKAKKSSAKYSVENSIDTLIKIIGGNDS